MDPGRNETNRADMLGVLYERYAHEIKRFIRRYVKTYEEAEDVTDEMFVKAFQHFDPAWAGNPYLFKGWANKVILRQVGRLSLQNRRNQQISLEDLQERMGTNFLNELVEEPMDGALEKKEMRGKMKALLSSSELKEKYRHVLKLRYIHDMSIENISVLLSIKERTIEQHVHRGLKKLRALFPTEE